MASTVVTVTNFSPALYKFFFNSYYSEPTFPTAFFFFTKITAFLSRADGFTH